MTTSAVDLTRSITPSLGGCLASVCKQLGVPTKSSLTVQRGSRLRLHLQLRQQRCDCSSNQPLQRQCCHMGVQAIS